jgi:hypothetical protein
MPPVYSDFYTCSNTKLQTIINHLRKQMILSGLSTGFTSTRTLQLSQQLDYFLNIEIRQRNKKIAI